MSPRRTVATLASSAVLAAGLVGLAPTSASAAWTTVTEIHRATLQVCRATVGGDPAIRFRLDNRDARHAHRGQVGRTRDGVTRIFSVQQPAGRLSSSVTVRVRSGDTLGGGIQDLSGAGGGGGIVRSSLPRC